MMKDLCVIGLGYIGLPTAIFFASKGYQVHGYDINPKVIHSLKKQHIPFDEPGLTERFQSVVQRRNLTFSTSLTPSDVYITAVPTPLDANNHADLSYVKNAIKHILLYLKRGDLIIVESTIPPRTLQDVIAPLLREKGFYPEHNDVYIAYCPERVIPGNIFKELNENDRIIGGYTKEAAEKAAKLFQPNIQGKVYQTTALTAEMTKLMENTYRDVNIALANELALISEDLDVNALEIIKLANKHPRVHIHEPGPGVGGHCIPIDPYFIIEKANGFSRLIETARKINENMPRNIVEKVNELKYEYSIENIAILGLAYKGNVSDLRESPSIPIIKQLMEQGYSIRIHDPYVHKKDISFSVYYSLEESLREADLALVLVNHKQYFELEERTFSVMNQKLVFDTKNCIQPNEQIQLFQLGKKLKVSV